MPDTPAIEVRRLAKQYPAGKRAVDDVSFDIHRGETLALLPTGAEPHLQADTVPVTEASR